MKFKSKRERRKAAAVTDKAFGLNITVVSPSPYGRETHRMRGGREGGIPCRALPSVTPRSDSTLNLLQKKNIYIYVY